MDLNFTEASTLAIIDRQIGEIGVSTTPSQYEIIRQVICASADLEYKSLLKFSRGALEKGAAALTAVTPIIVDVPEIQVNIVPKLQQTFINPVYCCATTNSEVSGHATKASSGLKVLGAKYPNAIYLIGQDRTALAAMVDSIEDGIIKPSLAIATPPSLIESDIKKRLSDSDIPNIHIVSAKGGAHITTAIFNSLLELAWQVNQRNN